MNEEAHGIFMSINTSDVPFILLGWPAVDVCIPGWGLAGSDLASLQRCWPSAGKGERHTQAWQQMLFAVPCQHGEVPLGLATLFNFALKQHGKRSVSAESQLGSNQQLRGS